MTNVWHSSTNKKWLWGGWEGLGNENKNFFYEKKSDAKKVFFRRGHLLQSPSLKEWFQDGPAHPPIPSQCLTSAVGLMIVIIIISFK